MRVMNIKQNLKLLLETFISIIIVLKKTSFFNVKYLPRASNKDIYVFGNGPSLTDQLYTNLEFFLNKNIFCVNFFCKHDLFIKIKPNYYVLADPNFYLQSNSHSITELQYDIYNILKNNVFWNLSLFIPSSTDMGKFWHNLAYDNNNIHVIFFNKYTATGFKKITHFLYKRNYAMPPAQNVLHAAIFLSLNMGYTNIYLLGADHSWLCDIKVNDKNVLYIVDKHFYGNDTIPFYKCGASNDIWKMHEILFTWSRTFFAYFILNEYAQYLNKSVINLTSNSYIDAFPKKYLKDVIACDSCNNSK